MQANHEYLLQGLIVQLVAHYMVHIENGSILIEKFTYKIATVITPIGPYE